MPDFGSAAVWMSLLTLTFLEIVLGIDNIIFISIASNKLPPAERPRATNVGLILAMVMRIVLLFGISALVAMEKPWFTIGDENSCTKVRQKFGTNLKEITKMSHLKNRAVPKLL